MKYNKLYIAFIILIAGLMWGCEEYEDTVDPSPTVPAGNQGVYFPETNISDYEMEPTANTEIEMTVARTETSGSVEVPITVVINTDSVFVVPDKIAFESGEEEKAFTVTFPDADVGKTYNLKLLIEGDEYVNPYISAEPSVSTSVTRIKWDPVVDTPFVYIDGAISAFWGVDFLPMYVDVERAELGGVTKYRFKNAYGLPTGSYDGDEYEPEPDADGIYDGYPYNEPGDVDESRDYYTVIEINEDGEVFMEPRENGMDWGYGQFIIGSVYPYASSNKGDFPPGQLSGDVIVFPENSLYVAMVGYNDAEKRVASNPTTIYLTKEAYIAANMRIEDFNEVEYEGIDGALGEFLSAAYGESWNQTIAKAIDIDEENEASEYKDLYYLTDLYTEGYGLAFYYAEGGSVRIPANQPTGKEAFGKEVYVSPSETLESSVEINSKGITVYSLGLSFHFEDGTELGDFVETFYYSEDPVSFDKEDFLGAFTLTGPSQFGDDEPAADMDVTIAEGDDENVFVITGVDFAEELIAIFDPDNSIMSISPQVLADFNEHDLTFLTTDENGVSDESILEFTINMNGEIVIGPTSVADGYILFSESAGGFVDGYYDLVFSRKSTRSKNVVVRKDLNVNTHSSIVRSDSSMKDVVTHNFKIGKKKSSKRMRTHAGASRGF